MPVTFEPKHNSDAERSGHVYTQYYNSSKNQFDAKGIYPLQGNNKVFETLVMQQTQHDIKEGSEHRKCINPAVVTESPKRSGLRVTIELSNNNDRT
jgi:hypothetical protein